MCLEEKAKQPVAVPLYQLVESLQTKVKYDKYNNKNRNLANSSGQHGHNKTKISKTNILGQYFN